MFSFFFFSVAVSIVPGHFSWPTDNKVLFRTLMHLSCMYPVTSLPAQQGAPVLNNQFRGQVATSLKWFSGFYHFDSCCVCGLHGLVQHGWSWPLSARSDSLCEGWRRDGGAIEVETTSSANMTKEMDEVSLIAILLITLKPQEFASHQAPVAVQLRREEAVAFITLSQMSASCTPRLLIHI